jgi:hypothetical protein
MRQEAKQRQKFSANEYQILKITVALNMRDMVRITIDHIDYNSRFHAF